MASPHSASDPTSFGQGYSLSASSSPSSPPASTPIPPPTSRQQQQQQRKEILNYSAPWPVYGLDWSNQPTEREALRLAVGSFIEDGSNKVRALLILFTPLFTLGSLFVKEISCRVARTMSSLEDLYVCNEHVDSNHHSARVCGY